MRAGGVGRGRSGHGVISTNEIYDREGLAQMGRRKCVIAGPPLGRSIGRSDVNILKGEGETGGKGRKGGGCV